MSNTKATTSKKATAKKATTKKASTKATKKATVKASAKATAPKATAAAAVKAVPAPKPSKAKHPRCGAAVVLGPVTDAVQENGGLLVGITVGDRTVPVNMVRCPRCGATRKGQVKNGLLLIKNHKVPQSDGYVPTPPYLMQDPTGAWVLYTGTDTTTTVIPAAPAAN